MVCVTDLCGQSAYQAIGDALRADLVVGTGLGGVSSEFVFLCRLTLVPLIVGMALREAVAVQLLALPSLRRPRQPKVVPPAKAFAKTNKKVLGLCQNRPGLFGRGV